MIMFQHEAEAVFGDHCNKLFYCGPSRDLLVAGHQEATRELWPSLTAVYDTYVSALVYEEVARGDLDQASRGW
jgi:hypothetical protein